MILHHKDSTFSFQTLEWAFFSKSKFVLIYDAQIHAITISLTLTRSFYILATQNGECCRFAKQLDILNFTKKRYDNEKVLKSHCVFFYIIFYCYLFED